MSSNKNQEIAVQKCFLFNKTKSEVGGWWECHDDDDAGICTKILSISIKSTNLNLMVALKERSEGIHRLVPKLMEMHPIVVGIFQTGPKVVDRPTSYNAERPLHTNSNVNKRTEIVNILGTDYYGSNREYLFCTIVQY